MLTTARAELYRSPAAFERERHGVFAKSWQFLGLERDLAETGDYLADSIAGFPVVVVRGKDGALNGFHNVCRHRAGPLVGESAGKCEGEFVCRYHGWRYTLDGRLRSAVGFGAAEGFDPRNFPLFPIRVETWRGFVFVNLDADAAPLMDTLQPLEALWRERNIEIPAADMRRSHSLGCNWKVYVENYLEGYHISAVHPTLAAEVDCAAYQVRMDGQIAVHEVPSAEGSTQEGLWAWVWPNLAVNVYRRGLMIEHMRPDGFGRTRLDYLYLHHADEPMDDTLAASDRLTAEDAWICEKVQQNLDAGVYEFGALSPRQENAVAWFQAQVAQAHARRPHPAAEETEPGFAEGGCLVD
ncbi:SRPBCC family protein [Caulobacter sp. 17J65-9]|uniref:aromatic ring-hydroxylating oxygenase subunit alpha n=1 Tax=Caulobacter sp. 17J65-9 TaxID=2709382 RepID=UPI0013C78020|nr:SRPBCC family protein [Caulobacter sp. 17J65-9]NEX92618.1 Rieske 2Fe-2S domain-containing protein [Caulobacter sp. 17J65-9]